MYKRLLTLIGVCILLICTPCKAEITPQLLAEWGRQPSNVQWNVFYQNTNIQVVDNLGWQSANLYDTYAYTTLNVSNGLVNSIDMRIKRGYEFALTHEVGHCISNANGVPYARCYTPEFERVWQLEKYNCVFLVGQGEYDIREYFAEAYATYIRYPLILKQSCPLTYNYIDAVVKLL